MDKFDDDYPSLGELLAAAFAGHKKAVDLLGRLYNPFISRRVRYYLRRKGCNAFNDHFPEIINSVWLSIIEHGEQLKDSEKFESWTDTIISNLVSGHVSGSKGCINHHNQTVQLEPTQVARIEHPKNIIEASVLVNQVVKHAYTRSRMFGDIVVLHHVQGYTMDEVARLLGHTLPKVRSHYYRHLDYLQQLLRGDRPAANGKDSSGLDDDPIQEDEEDDGDDRLVH